MNGPRKNGLMERAPVIRAGSKAPHAGAAAVLAFAILIKRRKEFL